MLVSTCMLDYWLVLVSENFIRKTGPGQEWELATGCSDRHVRQLLRSLNHSMTQSLSDSAILWSASLQQLVRCTEIIYSGNPQWLNYIRQKFNLTLMNPLSYFKRVSLIGESALMASTFVSHRTMPLRRFTLLRQPMPYIQRYTIEYMAMVSDSTAVQEIPHGTLACGSVAT